MILSKISKSLLGNIFRHGSENNPLKPRIGILVDCLRTFSAAKICFKHVFDIIQVSRLDPCIPKICGSLRNFISNSNDENLIASKEGQEKLARGVFNGFAEYYELYGKGKENKQGNKKTEVTAKEKAVAPAGDKPVFKIQIMASDSKLKSNDKRLKGLDADYYTENGVYKYTYGESEDYNEIQKIKKQISDKFKDAFVIAFLNGEKINTGKAIEMFKKQTKAK